MVSILTCQRDRGPLTEYVQRTTHTDPYILDRTTIESTLWIEAYLWTFKTISSRGNLFFNLGNQSIEVLITEVLMYWGLDQCYCTFSWENANSLINLGQCDMKSPEVLQCSIQKIPWNQDQLVFLWELILTWTTVLKGSEISQCPINTKTNKYQQTSL